MEHAPTESTIYSHKRVHRCDVYLPGERASTALYYWLSGTTILLSYW